MTLARALAVTLVAVCSSLGSAAQEWPKHTVTIIVPFIAGSTPDSVTRILADRLQQKLGRPVVVENRPGASGNTGTAAVAKAAADGHTLGTSIIGPLVINPLLFARMPYDPAKDLAPITILAAQPSVLTLTPSLPAASVDALIALLKREPQAFTYGSIGRGSLSHLAMAAIARTAGVDLVHLPFPGSPAVVSALLRGDVQLAVLPAAAVAGQGAQGALRLLAVTSANRSLLLPDLPTLRDAGVPGVEADAWIGLIAPAATPPPILDTIHREVIASLTEPEVVAKLTAQFMLPVANSPAEFRAVLMAERERWAPIIAAAAIKAE